MFTFFGFEVGDGGVVEHGFRVHGGRGFGSRVGHLVAGDANVCSDPGELNMNVLGSGGVEGMENINGEDIVAVWVKEFGEGRLTIGKDVEGVEGRRVIFFIVEL